MDVKGIKLQFIGMFADANGDMHLRCGRVRLTAREGVPAAREMRLAARERFISLCKHPASVSEQSPVSVSEHTPANVVSNLPFAQRTVLNLSSYYPKNTKKSAGRFALPAAREEKK